MNPQVVLLGAPGAGKGTQAADMVEKLGYKHVSTGDLLRGEIAKGSELGQKVAGILERGDLVDDQTVLDLLKANCDISDKAYIFDGFPRTLAQAQALDSQVLMGAKTLGIYFDIDLEILVQRIANRRVAPKSGQIYNLITRPPKVEGKCDVSGEDLIQRKDDNEETVRNRMQVFKDTITPILDFYESKNMLVRIDATKPQGEVFDLITGLIKE